jgi:hypothetical protein
MIVSREKKEQGLFFVLRKRFFNYIFYLFVEDYVCMQFGRVSDGKFVLKEEEKHKSEVHET